MSLEIIERHFEKFTWSTYIIEVYIIVLSGNISFSIKELFMQVLKLQTMTNLSLIDYTGIKLTVNIKFMFVNFRPSYIPIHNKILVQLSRLYVVFRNYLKDLMFLFKI